MKKDTKSLLDVISELSKHSHAFFKSDDAESMFLKPFGISKSKLERTIKCEGGKGLSGYNGEKKLTGISVFDIPQAIMAKFGIKRRNTYFGRGKQFKSDLDQIKEDIEHIKANLKIIS